jgi:hypothetical protein
MTAMINPPTPWEMDTGSFIRLYHDADQLTRDNIVIAMHLKLAEQRKEIAVERVYGKMTFFVLCGMALLMMTL